MLEMKKCRDNTSFNNVYLYHRFSDAAGTLNEEKFMKSYDFINEYQRDEVSKLEKALKKKKKDEDREAIQAELIR
jgi:hypothetical protein